jgi:hypothetical protein
MERSNSGLIGAEGNLSGSSGDLHEGASNLPIDIPNDRNRIPQNDNENQIPQNEREIAQNDNRIPQDDDGWVEDNGWLETQNPIAQNENEIPRTRGERYGKFRQGKRGENKSKRGKKTGRSQHDNRSLEAEAHFAFELAKKVLMLAMGATPSPNAIFGQAEPTNTVTQSICNRPLQLCAFELGLFALGLHNLTCFNWRSRTYSAHVSWISTQALELGNVALGILLEKWAQHLTAAEVASIADRASKSNDQVTVQTAAQLALACLSMAHTLNPGFIRSSLGQCKDQGSALLEQACMAVESAAGGGGVYPEILFEVAKHWEYLYEQSEENKEEQNSSSRGDQDDAREDHEDSRVSHDTHDSREELHEPRHGASSQPTPQPLLVKVSRVGPYNRNYGLFIPLATPEQLVQQQISQQVQHLIEAYQVGLGQQQVPYRLVNAYRVGMLALENLGRRPSDDQSNTMLAKNPPYKTDIHWLCNIANKVGLSSLQRFCRVCVNSIHSPFVLHELALEAAGLMAKSNPNQIAFHLRSPSLSPMVQKCLMNYAQCVQQNLQGLPKSEYPEFVELIMHARGAYCMAPGGMTSFNDLLQNVRRSTAKKKDLWQKITTGLAHQQK